VFAKQRGAEGTSPLEYELLAIEGREGGRTDSESLVLTTRILLKTNNKGNRTKGDLKKNIRKEIFRIAEAPTERKSIYEFRLHRARKGKDRKKLGGT